MVSILELHSGSDIVAICSGVVTFVGFNGGNGYTVTIEADEFTVSYSHVSPNFLVFVGQYIPKGMLIANVGPKNVYGVPNNPYKDSNGNPTNGSTTGPHLHISIKKDGKAVNPLDYISSSSSWWQWWPHPLHPHSSSSQSAPQSNSTVLLQWGQTTSSFNSSISNSKSLSQYGHAIEKL